MSAVLLFVALPLVGAIVLHILLKTVDLVAAIVGSFTP